MASTIGTSHIAATQPCQDSHGCKILRDSSGQPVVVLVASDGAGSASVADIGSALACETFVKSNVVVIGGEITTKAKLDFEKIARAANMNRE